ncbi:ATP-binding protein [Paramuribaculum intestinale]
MAYVNKMVRELGGQITVESELGQGTRFIITLPLAKR